MLSSQVPVVEVICCVCAEWNTASPCYVLQAQVEAKKEHEGAVHLLEVSVRALGGDWPCCRVCVCVCV